MTRRRDYSNGRRYRRSNYYGLRRRLEHIAAADRLTAELGGMDQEVKAYFFSLPPSELTAILDDYERAYGRLAREYAAETIPRWRSGRRRMSGMVAERLFNLLPPRMPLATKYKLVERLWHHIGPSNRYQVRVEPDTDVAQVLKLAQARIADSIVSYTIPIALERRFSWLAGGDVSVKQLLLNHVQEIQKHIAIEAIREQLPVMLEHMRSAESSTRRLAQIVQIGKYELEIIVGKTRVASADIADSTRTARRSANGPDRVLIWIIIALSFISLCVIAGMFV